MRSIILKSVLSAIVLLQMACSSGPKVELNSQYMSVGLDGKGSIIRIMDKNTGDNYTEETAASPLLKLYDGENYILPEALRMDGDLLVLTYPNQSEAVIKKEEKGEYIRFELTSLSNRDHITAVVWGPYATKLSQFVGETVGIVRDTVFAIGMQALDLNTIEGLPHLGKDAGGGCIIDPLPGQVVPDELKEKIGQQVDFVNVNVEGDMPDYLRSWRGTAAFKKPYGSDIQLFSHDWKTSEVIDLYGRKQTVDAVDQDYIGSAIALFACPASKTLDVIEAIELTEGLPHPMIDGVWVKRWEKANHAYMLYEGASLDQALNYVDSCNFSLLHIGDFFKSWGHFDLTTTRFPGGAKEIKAFTDKARDRGVSIGVHTLTMFTSQHDPYISPVPSDSLCIAGKTTLSRDITEQDDEIFIDDPAFFVYTGPTRTVKIGKELIAYNTVSTDKPYRLLACTRGQFGTKIASHTTGETVEKLVNDDYSGFFPNIQLQDKYADRLAEVCKETGIDLMDFDGYGGGSPTGHGTYGAGLFVDRWYKALDRYRITCGAGTFHSYWHIYTFMNWGEPWYDNLRESQVNYRLENQRYFERNLMPGMLGWFKLEPTYRPEDIEWIQARSAAFDAGYLLRVDESIEQNGFKSRLFESIREWQKVRNMHLLTAAQLERMKNPKSEFHLEKAGENEWNLYDVTLKGGNQHKYRLVQAGEPLVSKFTFDNPYEKQPIQFYATILQGEDPNGKINRFQLLIEGNAPIEIPMELKTGYKLYSDGTNVYVCDGFWKPLAQYPLPKVASWSEGGNKVTLACDFSSSKAPVIDIEFKTLGNRERVKAK